MKTYINRRVGNILTSGLIYKLVVKPAIRNGFLKTDTGFICVKDQSPYLQSLIYWKIYERSEVKLIRKYLNTHLPVVEFGASLGMTSSTICSTVNKDIPVFSVEANPKLINNLNETKSKNNFANLTVIRAAVDYSGSGTINFILDESNLGSRKGNSHASVSVPTIKLSEIILTNDITQYSLVCDIEGAELEMFINENNSRVIQGCMQIIIELHPASYNGKNYVPAEINSIILEKFKMKAVLTDGKTWVYEKK